MNKAESQMAMINRLRAETAELKAQANEIMAAREKKELEEFEKELWNDPRNAHFQELERIRKQYGNG